MARFGAALVTDTQVIQVGMQAMMVAAKLSAPVLVTALLIGLLISLLQSVTQVQEVTLSFVPKMVGVGLALLVSGNWMLHTMVSFTTDLLETTLPHLLAGG